MWVGLQVGDLGFIVRDDDCDVLDELRCHHLVEPNKYHKGAVSCSFVNQCKQMLHAGDMFVLLNSPI